MKLFESDTQKTIDTKYHRLSWRDPVVWCFILLAIAGTVISSIESGEWLSSVIFLAGVLLASFLVLLLTRNRKKAESDVAVPGYEYWILLTYYALFMAASMLAKGEGIFANEFTKWIWFVIFPFVLLLLIHRHNLDIRDIFRSIGFSRQSTGRALLLGFLAYLVFVPLLFFVMPESQIQKLQILFQEPGKALIILPLSFVFSLFTAAFTEEFFFRGMLQSSLTRLTGSEMRSCLITAFLFGIYHFPYAFFSSSWPTYGNLLWAASSVLAEQMITGLLLGILFFRSRNILAPVLLHALINTPAIMSMLNFNLG